MVTTSVATLITSIAENTGKTYDVVYHSKYESPAAGGRSGTDGLQRLGDSTRATSS